MHKSGTFMPCCFSIFFTVKKLLIIKSGLILPVVISIL